MKLFISYRRKGNVQRAMNLASVMRENFGKDNVFLDTGDIEIGQSFPEIISDELNQADVLIALIGQEWLSSLDDNFRRRIASPGDWVHIEIATALSKKENYHSGLCRRREQSKAGTASRATKIVSNPSKLRPP